MSAPTEKTILVTGATGGIGVAVSLVLAARDAARLQMLTEELRRTDPGTHAWISVDMTKDESVSAFAAELASRNLTFDGVVLMPPQPHRSDDPLPSSDAWRGLSRAALSDRWLC